MTRNGVEDLLYSQGLLKIIEGMSVKYALIDYLLMIDLSAHEKLFIVSIARQCSSDGWAIIKSSQLMSDASIKNQSTFSQIRSRLIEKKLINFELNKKINRGIYRLNFQELYNLELCNSVQNNNSCITSSYGGQNSSITSSYASPPKSDKICSKNGVSQDKSAYGKGGGLGGDRVLDNKKYLAFNNLDINNNKNKNKNIYCANVQKTGVQSVQMHRQKCTNAHTVQLFKKWYEHYPIKKNKGRALKAFEKLNPDESLTHHMINGVEAQKHERSMRTQNALWNPEWPLPATWINDRRWEDEVNLDLDNQQAALDEKLKERERLIAEEESQIKQKQEKKHDSSTKKLFS